MITGIARGGPMDGDELQGRYPKGVVLVDKMASRAWIYDWDDEAEEFNVREADGRELDRNKQWQAAEGSEYEVRAAPWLV